MPRRSIEGGLVKFLAAGCGLNEGSPLENNVDDFSEIIYERSSASRNRISDVTLSARDRRAAERVLLREGSRRSIEGGLVKFLAVGCGLNEVTPLANNVDDFSEIIYERSSAARRNTLTTSHSLPSTLCPYVASDKPSLMHRG